MFSHPSVPGVRATDVDPASFLLDVREPQEWRLGHVEGSVHIPMNELPGRLADLPTDRPIVVVCRVGGRSAQVTAWLTAQGYDATNLTGGLVDWASAQLPLVTGTGSPGSVG